MVAAWRLLRHSQLDVLRAIAINLTSLDPQTTVGKDLGFAVDAHAAASRQIDDHHAHLRIVCDVPEQWIAVEGSRRCFECGRIKHT